jgi:hypothetical protein
MIKHTKQTVVKQLGIHTASPKVNIYMKVETIETKICPFYVKTVVCTDNKREWYKCHAISVFYDRLKIMSTSG